MLDSAHPKLVLVLENIPWAEEEFSQTGISHISSKRLGIYELLASDGAILRIGEGQIASRLKQHLHDLELLSKVRKVRYMELHDKEETEFLERISTGRL